MKLTANELGFKIDSGIPIPPRGGKGKTTGVTATLRALQVGESFLFPGINSRLIGGQIAYVQKSTGARFTCRKQADGLRVWRTE